MRWGQTGLTLWAALALVACGCRRENAAGDEEQSSVTVTVSRPVQREVTEYAYFIGRTEAVNSVEIKARVTGYLEKTPFQEGGEVQAGAVLCEIDPRTYQAQLDAAQGDLLANEAKYRLAKTENERAQALYKENPKAISLKALDQHQAEEDSAAAAVIASKSALEVYKLNLEFTKVTSPLEGRVGRYQVTVGNLVTENATTLTTVVSQDPIYVYFNVDEPTMLSALRKLYAEELPPLASKKFRVGMALQDEQGFPHEGTIDFADNTVDPSTGTISVRASFDNPANPNGLRLLMPGLFVRVRMPLGKPQQSVLIAEQAVGTDQGQKYVYVVNREPADDKTKDEGKALAEDEGVVQYRRVTLGQLQDDGLQVITSGLAPTDRIIVSGLQIVHPKMTVKIDETPMPTNQQPDSSAETDTTTQATEPAGG